MRLHSRSASAAVFGLALALSLAGCAAEQRSDARPVIGLLVQNTKIGYTMELGEGFQAGAQLAGGVRATVAGPPTPDAPKQVELFDRLAASARGGIAAAPAAPELLARPQAQAVNNGIPVIAVSARAAPGSGVRLLIESDNYELGTMLADQAIDRMPPDATGKVIVGTNQPAQPALDQRAKGMRDRFADRLPGVRVMGPFDTQKEPSANLAAWRVLVAANPDAAAFLGTGDLDAISLANIRASTGGSWLAGGYSVDFPALRAVKDGQLFAVVSPEHFLTSAVAGWLLAEHAKDGRPLPQGWYAKTGLMITSANVDEILQRESSDATKLAWFKPQIDMVTANIAQSLRPLEQVR
jgi:ribose transport system substrate-binding protein